MIVDEFKEQTVLMYETVREIFQDRLVRLDQYIAVYQEAGDLADLSDEELADVLPVAIAQQKEVKAIVEKLNHTETRDWFVEFVNGQLDEKVSEEDAEVLSKALEVQTRIDGIFEQGSNEFVSYLTKDLGEKVVIN